MWWEYEHVQKFFPFFIFLLKVCNSTTDRNHADTALEKYVTETVMAIVKGFFSSPFSVNHSNLQVLFFTSDKQVKCAHRGRLTPTRPKPLPSFSYFTVKFDSRFPPSLPLLVSLWNICTLSSSLRCFTQRFVCPHSETKCPCSLSSFYRQTSLSSSSCCSLLSGSITARGSAHLRRLILRAVSKH